jgi:N-methylhydantoinase A
MRFMLQVHEVSVPVPLKTLTRADLQKVGSDFVQVYEKIYGKGTALPHAGMEAVLFRVDGIGKIPKPAIKRQASVSSSAKSAIKGSRNVYFRHSGASAKSGVSRRAGKFVPTTVFDGSSLKAGHKITGPAIVDYPTTTIVVPPGRSAKVDAYMNVLLA